MAKVKQSIGDIDTNIITTKDEVKETFITIHQNGKTIFLEHAKIVEFLKTVNNFK